LIFFQEFQGVDCFISVTKQKSVMKSSASARVIRIEEDEHIQKMFENYNRQVKGLLMFTVVQLVILFSII